MPRKSTINLEQIKGLDASENLKQFLTSLLEEVTELKQRVEKLEKEKGESEEQ